MAISFSCHQCGKSLSVRDELAGRRGKCPDCQAIVLVPGEKSESSVHPVRSQSSAAENRSHAVATPPPAARRRGAAGVQGGRLASSSGGERALVRVVEDVTGELGFRLTKYESGELVVEKGNFPLSCMLGAIAPYSRFHVQISATNPGLHQFSLRRNTPWWTGFIGVSQVRKKFDRFVRLLVDIAPQHGAKVLDYRLEKTTAEIHVSIASRSTQLPTTRACPMCAEDVSASAVRCQYCGHDF